MKFAVVGLGREHGMRAAFMVGGPRGAFDVVRPLGDLAVDDDAVFYAGASSAGHVVTLVHNAIEFGMILDFTQLSTVVEDTGEVP